VLVTRAHSGRRQGPEVRIKLITTAGRPQAIAQARTDATGRAAIEVTVPSVARGAAALVVQAMAGKDSAETRRAVEPAARAAARG
jgi:hypothetical protein